MRRSGLAAIAWPLASLVMLSACSERAGEAGEKSLEKVADKIEAKADDAVNAAINELEATSAVDEGEGDETLQNK